MACPLWELLGCFFETMFPFGMPFVVTFGSFLETVVPFDMSIVVTFGSLLETMVPFYMLFVMTLGLFFRDHWAFLHALCDDFWFVFSRP